MAAKRTKKIDKHLALDGIELEAWRREPTLLKWAQNHRYFKLLVTVMVKERKRVIGDDPTVTENRKLGRVEGYEEAINVLLEMSRSMPKEPEVDETMTYNSEETLEESLID